MRRHHSFAVAMSALLAYKNRPEGYPEPIKTNWALVASNDNEPEVVSSMGYERIQLTTPSVDEIMRQVATGEVERNTSGQIVRIGRLRFSDGTQVEAGYKRGQGGDAVPTKHTMPAGAMLGCQDRPHTTIGGEEDPTATTASNNYFVEMFGVKKRRRVPSSKRAKRNGQAMTPAEAKAELAKAYANTTTLPEVKHCPPGLPAASNKIADSFLGLQKARASDSGSTGWEDISTAMVDREVWAQAIADLSERDREVLDTAAHRRARTYQDIGTSIGLSPKYSKYNGGGRRALRSANDNLATSLRKISG